MYKFIFILLLYIQISSCINYDDIRQIYIIVHPTNEFTSIEKQTINSIVQTNQLKYHSITYRTDEQSNLVPPTNDNDDLYSDVLALIVTPTTTIETLKTCLCEDAVTQYHNIVIVTLGTDKQSIQLTQAITTLYMVLTSYGFAATDVPLVSPDDDTLYTIDTSLFTENRLHLYRTKLSLSTTQTVCTVLSTETVPAQMTIPSPALTSPTYDENVIAAPTITFSIAMFSQYTHVLCVVPDDSIDIVHPYRIYPIELWLQHREFITHSYHQSQQTKTCHRLIYRSTDLIPLTESIRIVHTFIRSIVYSHPYSYLYTTGSSLPPFQPSTLKAAEYIHMLFQWNIPSCVIQTYISHCDVYDNRQTCSLRLYQPRTVAMLYDTPIHEIPVYTKQRLYENEEYEQQQQQNTTQQQQQQQQQQSEPSTIVPLLLSLCTNICIPILSFIYTLCLYIFSYGIVPFTSTPFTVIFIVWIGLIPITFVLSCIFNRRNNNTIMIDHHRQQKERQKSRLCTGVFNNSHPLMRKHNKIPCYQHHENTSDTLWH